MILMLSLLRSDPNAEAMRRHFCLPDNQALDEFDAAMTYLKGGDYWECRHITLLENFDKLPHLTQVLRCEIALYIAEHRSPAPVASRFKDLGITDQGLAFRIAHFIAKKHANSINQPCIKDFPLTEAQRVAIAEVVIKDSFEAWNFARQLAHWNITDQKVLLKLAEKLTAEKATHYVYFKDHLKDGPDKVAFAQRAFEQALKEGELINDTESFRGCFPEFEAKAMTLFPKLKAKVDKVENVILRAQLNSWLWNTQMRVMAIWGHGAPPEVEMLAVELMEYRSPEERAKLSKNIFWEFADADNVKRWRESLPTATSGNIHRHVLIPLAYLSWILPTKKSKAELIDYGKQLASKRDVFRNGPAFSILIKFLFELESFPTNRRRELLAQMFYKNEDVIKRLRLMTAIFKIGSADAIPKEPISLVEIEKIRTGVLEKLFGFLPKQVTLYDQIMATWRDPLAPFVYAGKIEALGEDSKKPMQDAFRNFIGHLLLGTVRLQRQSSPHLAALDPVVVRKWNNLDKTAKPLESYMPKVAEEKTFTSRFHTFLQQHLVQDKHVEQWQTRLPFVARFLLKQESPEALAKALSAEMQTPENQIQDLILKVLLSKSEEAPSLLVALSGKTQEFAPLFYRDLQELLAALKQKNNGAMTIGVTDDPCDLMLLAKETGGCQSIDGNPDYNKCALAYMVDGKNLPIYVRGEDGRLKGRAVLRLLEQRHLQRPVLFLERYYGLPDLDAAINAYAIEVATKMKVPLTTKEAANKAQVFLGTLDSHGSNAPFEYSDAGGGRTEGGKFSIIDPIVMYMPPQTHMPTFERPFA
jgi:hypothetical protein